jgi:hypothetical protein
VVGHLLALIPGDAASQLSGQRADRLPHGLLDQVRVPPGGQVQQHNEPGAAFDQGADGGLQIAADEQIPFPMAGHGPVLRLGRTFADHHHVPDLAGVLIAAAGTALGPPGAQAAGQLAAELAAALHIQRLVDSVRTVGHNLVLTGPSGAGSSVASEHSTSTPDSYADDNRGVSYGGCSARCIANNPPNGSPRCCTDLVAGPIGQSVLLPATRTERVVFHHPDGRQAKINRKGSPDHPT